MSRTQKTDGTSRCLAQMENIKRQSLNIILDNPWPFDVEFAEDSVNVELRFDNDYVDKYLDKYDDGPICRVNGTYAEIADLVKEKIESTFVGAL